MRASQYLREQYHKTSGNWLSEPDQIVQIDPLRNALESMIIGFSEIVFRHHFHQIYTHDYRVNFMELDFHFGDFNLVNISRKSLHKLELLWCGTQRLIEIRRLRSQSPYTPQQRYLARTLSLTARVPAISLFLQKDLNLRIN